MMKALLAIAIMLAPGMAWAGSNGLFDGVSSGNTTYIQPNGSGGYIATQPASPSIINNSGYEREPFGRNQLQDAIRGYPCPQIGTCN
jgi:hypothetical protein